MLKETVQYTDFDDKPQVETLYFNFPKTAVTKNVALFSRYQTFAEKIKSMQGTTQELPVEDVQEMLDLVVSFMRLSYGIRSEDGKRHYQSDEIWTDFVASPVYDAFLWDLFTNVETKAAPFLFGIMPKDIREQVAAAQTAQENVVVPQADASVVETTPDNVSDDDRPAWLVENRAPSKEEFAVATPEQKLLAFEMTMKA